MDVSGAAGVMTREGRLEMNDTVGVTLLDTSEEGRVDVQLIRGVAIATGNNS
jgi:5-hydroxyisourate hydrolase-like protein (transthyretin family)